jgi:8-oxo-dGTP diphosphatase
VQVVAAVLLRDDGSFLLAQRPSGKVYAGYWEFPGGKVEPGETAEEALARELHEELGIEVRQAYPWIVRRHVYEHATVDLNFFRVTRFEGEPHGRENQAFVWQRSGALTVAPMLPANGPILAALALPSVYGITNATHTGCEVALRQIRSALANGLRLVQVREPGMSSGLLAGFASDVVALAHACAAKVVVNSDAALARACGADGLHLKARELMAASSRPQFELVGASCHDAAELQHAIALGVDFVVLGPVAPTLSHPGAPVLGFEAFARMIRGCPVPVYALGGMSRGDLDRAWRCGAHGIAMQRGAWEP